jgi:hypothetical protein
LLACGSRTKTSSHYVRPPNPFTATGTHSKSGSRNSHASEANFAGVGENGLSCLADGIEEGLKAHGEGIQEGLKAHGEGIQEGLKEGLKAQWDGVQEGLKAHGGGLKEGMKYIACSIAFSSVAICIAFR